MSPTTATLPKPWSPPLLSDTGVLQVEHVHIHEGDVDMILTRLSDPTDWDRDDRPCVRPGNRFQALRVEADRPLISDDGVDKLAGMVGYLWRSVLHAAPEDTLDAVSGGDYLHSDSRSVTFYAPSRYLKTSKAHFGFPEFIEELQDFLQYGSPLRKDGTRLIEGFGDRIDFSVWLTDVDVVSP